MSMLATAPGSNMDAIIVIGIRGDGTHDGTSITYVDPDGGATHH